MPYETGMLVLLAALAIVFATFLYLLINARSLMMLFRPMSHGEIKAGPGPHKPSKRGAAIALALHFAAWAVAGFAWLFMLADIRATASDTTPAERSGIVDGAGR